jgi:hypothetical protein
MDVDNEGVWQVQLGGGRERLQQEMNAALADPDGSSPESYVPSRRSPDSPGLGVAARDLDLELRRRSLRLGGLAALDASPPTKPTARMKILKGDVPLLYGDSMAKWLLWSPSLLSAADKEDCARLQAEFRRELEPVFQAVGYDFLFWTADQQEFKHFVDDMERTWEQLELLMASRKRVVAELLEQMPSVDEPDELARWQQGAAAERLRVTQAALKDVTTRRSFCRDFYLLGRLHVVKNGLIGFFKAYGDAGVRDIFLSFTEPGQVRLMTKMLICN